MLAPGDNGAEGPARGTSIWNLSPGGKVQQGCPASSLSRAPCRQGASALLPGWSCTTEGGTDPTSSCKYPGVATGAA